MPGTLPHKLPVVCTVVCLAGPATMAQKMDQSIFEPLAQQVTRSESARRMDEPGGMTKAGMYMGDRRMVYMGDNSVLDKVAVGEGAGAGPQGQWAKVG